MFVIPAAGPGETHTPDISVLDGVVSDGPQEAAAIVAAAKITNPCDLERRIVGARERQQNSHP
jgi:hypothetical protein